MADLPKRNQLLEMPGTKHETKRPKFMHRAGLLSTTMHLPAVEACQLIVE